MYNPTLAVSRACRHCGMISGRCRDIDIQTKLHITATHCLVRLIAVAACVENIVALM
jgi:hypothetical protein